MRATIAAWITARPGPRRLALRWSVLALVGFPLEVVLAAVLGRLGLVHHLLAPSSSAPLAVAALCGALLLALRIARVVVLPPALAVAWALSVMPGRNSSR